MDAYQISQEDFEKYQSLSDQEKIAFMYFLLKEKYVRQRTIEDEVRGDQILVGVQGNIIVLKTQSEESLQRELQAIVMDGYILRKRKLKDPNPQIHAYEVIGKNYPISYN